MAQRIPPIFRSQPTIQSIVGVTCTVMWSRRLDKKKAATILFFTSSKSTCTCTCARTDCSPAYERVHAHELSCGRARWRDDCRHHHHYDCNSHHNDPSGVRENKKQTLVEGKNRGTACSSHNLSQRKDSVLRWVDARTPRIRFIYAHLMNRTILHRCAVGEHLLHTPCGSFPAFKSLLGSVLSLSAFRDDDDDDDLSTFSRHTLILQNHMITVIQVAWWRCIIIIKSTVAANEMNTIILEK